MQTKTIKLYEYSELSPEAKEKALQNFRENDFDSYDLQVYLDNAIEPLLEKHGIKPVSDVKGYETKYAKIYWSLSHSQGDGVMFEGTFSWKGYTVKIKQSGHYYHSNSKTIDIETQKGTPATEGTEQRFEKIYQSICSQLEKAGYAYIEDMESEAYFIETCNANGYTFRENGIMENQ